MDYWGNAHDVWEQTIENSIEKNEETVDKKDIEESETQISIECIKVHNYLLEIETFEADGTVKEVKIMGKISWAKGFTDIQK